MVWTLDIRGFRQSQFKSRQDVEAALFAASNVGEMSQVQEMAIVNPEERASAAQMLVKCFNGEGLSNPRIQVPALPISLWPAIAHARAPARAPPLFESSKYTKKPERFAEEFKTISGRGSVPCRQSSWAISAATTRAPLKG